ncbi:MAG: polyphenol oxidase family protein [Desulfovibrionaceae bacterium]|nr:polyphenol oxidase family protein [Desulfovibrionaceae bacterium]
MAVFIPFAFPGLTRVHCLFQAGALPFPHGSDIAWNGRDEERHTLETRKMLFSQLGIPAAEMHQVHGNTLLFDPQPSSPETPLAALMKGDGLASDRRGLALLVRTADCQPIFVADESERYIMALHVGWRGNRSGFIGEAVGAFCDRYGLQKKQLYAVRGPSLGPACAEFVRFDEEWGEAFRPWYQAKTQTMDLWRLTEDQLLEAGLRRERLFRLDLCTFSLPEFYSYRRYPSCGRQANAVWIA